MSILNERQLGWLRAELGPDSDVADLNRRYGLLESVREVALEVLRERHNALLASPLSVNISGVAAVNFGENVKALERQMDRIAALPADPSAPVDEDLAGDARPLERYSMRRTRRR